MLKQPYNCGVSFELLSLHGMYNLVLTYSGGVQIEGCSFFCRDLPLCLCVCVCVLGVNTHIIMLSFIVVLCNICSVSFQQLFIIVSSRIDYRQCNVCTERNRKYPLLLV